MRAALVAPAMFWGVINAFYFTQKIVTVSHLQSLNLNGLIVPLVLVAEYIFVFFMLLTLFTAIINYIFEATDSVLLRVAIFSLLPLAYCLFVGNLASILMICSLIFLVLLFCLPIFM